MNPKLFDIHSHLNLSDFDQDWPEVLERTLAGDCWTITVGADLASSKKAVEIANTKTEGVWATVGFHPTDGVTPKPQAEADAEWVELATLAKNPKVVAIGECGFEFFRVKSKEQIEKQKDLFRKHIELAIQLNKPLMIHCRPSEGSMDAYEEAIEILTEYIKAVPREARRAEWGNFHFFAGDSVMAQKCLELGFTLSFTGVITFARQYDEVIKNMPLEMLLAETDAPFVAPVPYRGKRCEPLYVAQVVAKLAELRGLSPEQMAEITVANGRRGFGV